MAWQQASKCHPSLQTCWHRCRAYQRFGSVNSWHQVTCAELLTLFTICLTASQECGRPPSHNICLAVHEVQRAGQSYRTHEMHKCIFVQSTVSTGQHNMLPLLHHPWADALADRLPVGHAFHDAFHADALSTSCSSVIHSVRSALSRRSRGSTGAQG